MSNDSIICDEELAHEFPITVGEKAKYRFYGTFPISRKTKLTSLI